MAKNYGDTIWNLNRPGLVIEDAKSTIHECRNYAFILRTGTNSSREAFDILAKLQSNLDYLADLLGSVPPDHGPNIQTAANKALDLPIDVDVFANDSASEG